MCPSMMSPNVEAEALEVGSALGSPGICANANGGF
jgi:hypothetical protein